MGGSRRSRRPGRYRLEARLGEPAGSFEDRVGHRRQVAVDALQVSDHVHVDRVGLDLLGASLAHGGLLRDQAAGQGTSAGYGHTLGASVGLGYVKRRDGLAIDAAWLEGSRFEVDLAGTRLAARVSLRSPFDPAGTRIKA